jgi:5-methylthioadenosine/S-adenosylhomocysteine deaminase
MAEAIDLLVKADVLYPMTGGQTGEDDIVLGAEVAVRGGRIVHAGPARPEGSWKPARTLAGAGKAVLPGFVNCHSHTASIVFRSQSDDGAGGAALYTVAFRGEPEITPGQWGDLAALGVVDMIKAGITTINDVWHEPEALVAACLKAGLRAQVAQKIVDVRLEELCRQDYTRYPTLGEQRLRRAVGLVEAWHGAGGGLITGRIAPHATDTCSEGLHREAAAEARRLKVGRHTHVAQSKGEVDHIRAAHGKGPAEFLAEIGTLGPDSVLAHLTFASPGDLDAVREAGARYAHCATIYPRRGVYPDVPEIDRRGIPWGLATDWMLNDPFEAMRNAMNALRLRQGSHEALTSRQALHRATAGSAEVLGLGEEIGQLAPGFRADLIQIDIDQPHLAPFYADHASIAWYARASDVVTSVIAGRVVMEDRRVLGIDEADALATVKRHIPGWTGLMRRLGGAGHPGLCACGHG